MENVRPTIQTHMHANILEVSQNLLQIFLFHTSLEDINLIQDGGTKRSL